VIQKTGKFLGKAMSEDQVHQLADHLSFSNMKSNPATNLERFAKMERERYGLPDEEEDLHFLRQGETGGWRKDMTQAVADRLDAWTELRLRGTDYDLQVRSKINALEQVVRDHNVKETNSLPYRI
jgi:hypothetical protein